MVGGIKELVLTVALPSTIFIALMKIPLDSTLVLVPFLTILFNFSLFFLIPPVLGFFTIDKNSSIGRTIKMLLPSLAPGLSCFPFISEFLGAKSLAIAAMADVGNKFFCTYLSLYHSFKYVFGNKQKRKVKRLVKN